MDTTKRRQVVAVIPARGGSQGVPLKNLAPVGGVPLIVRAIRACRDSGAIDTIVVSTDHPAISEAALEAGAVVVDRPERLSGGTASSESAVLHALDQLGIALDPPWAAPEITLLVQCTSPFIEAKDLAAAVDLVGAGGCDVAFSATRSHAFLWAPDAEGVVGGINHDAAVRLRRQDRRVELRETGAFYVMRTAGLREAGHRFFGRIKAVEVAAWQAVEIDDPDDLELARALAEIKREPAQGSPSIEVLDWRRIDAVITDFDGVHTDDRARIAQDGTESVQVSRTDGMGVARLVAAGVPFLILSSETNPVVAARAEKLGVECRHGVSDKPGELRAWLDARGLDPSRVVYLGNDINDLGCLGLVGWPVAVADARPEVLSLARVVLTRAGGHGAVRELSDLLLAERSTTVTEKEKQR
jgi:N-acylneuraminate cytidylyltransferase